MDKEFYKLRIDKLILHEVFKIGENKTFYPPRYNTKLAVLNSEEREVLEQRIFQSLSKSSSSIEMDINDPIHNRAFLSVVSFLDISHPNKSTPQEEITAKFIDMSKSLTLQLAKSYNTQNIPGGVTIVFSGMTGVPAKRYVCIIKAEKDNGFSAQESEEEIILKLFNDLLLTQNQKLYKMAIYIEKTLRTYSNLTEDINNNFTTYLYDKNISFNSSNSLAGYFYHSFLDWCKAENAKHYTYQFYHLSSEFINSSTLSDTDKVNSITALHSYLHTNKSEIINLYDFAKTYLPDNLVDTYVNTISSQGIPTRDIVKNTDGFKKLEKISLKFSSNVSIIAPFKDFDNIIKVSTDEDGITIVKIKGSIIKQ